MARPRLLSSLLLLSLPFLGACGSGESETPGTSAVTDADGSTGMDGNEAPDGEEIMDHDETMDDLIPMVKYTWDNTVGDASVSAQMGGPGFTGEGWTTNMEFQAIGSADAIKGGSLKR
ncbi:MAG: hypothetical protein ACI9C2_001946, partial [Gammaproteobacteria bacterium]